MDCLSIEATLQRNQKNEKENRACEPAAARLFWDADSVPFRNVIYEDLCLKLNSPRVQFPCTDCLILAGDALGLIIRSLFCLSIEQLL